MKGQRVATKRTADAGGDFAAIRNLLGEDPICGEIVRYLSHHTRAMDTARGIAEWWINRELRTTEEALLKLLRHGVVRSFVVGATRVYAYTKDPLLRQTLAHYLKLIDGRPQSRKG